MTASAHTEPALAVTDDLARRNVLVISLLLVSAFVVILNETIMGVALPHLMKDLGITASEGQWLTTAFLLTMAVVIPITGFLLQRFNTRPVFMLAMSLFSLGTLLGGMAPGIEMLIFARVVQACGTAIMMPLLMTTVMNLVPAESRGRTMGYISTVISVAPALGPTISGLILSALDWRWMFWLVLPIALGALALGAWRIVDVTTPRKAPLDAFSVLLSVVGFGGLVYGLSAFGEAAGHGGAAVMHPAVPLVVGVAGLVVFVLRQLSLQRTGAALLDLRTFRSVNFSISLVTMAVSMVGMFGTIILLPIYLQNVLGIDALQTGLLVLPGGLVMGLMAPRIGTLYDKYGPRPLLVPGAFLVSAALWAFAFTGEATSVWYVLGLHVALSAGLALMFTPLFTASLGSLPKPLYSHGSAVIGTVQQVAGAAGIALLVTLMSIEAAELAAQGANQVTATAGGIHVAFTWGAAISLLGIVVSFFVTKPPGEAVVHAH